MLAEKWRLWRSSNGPRAPDPVFQGYFFTRPVIVGGRQISASGSNNAHLLQEARDELDFERLRVLIGGDVSFSFKLLRFTNSALFPASDGNPHVRHGLMALGEGEFADGLRLPPYPTWPRTKPASRSCK